jgi:hypothetical protein
MAATPNPNFDPTKHRMDTFAWDPGLNADWDEVKSQHWIYLHPDRATLKTTVCGADVHVRNGGPYQWSWVIHGDEVHVKARTWGSKVPVNRWRGSIKIDVRITWAVVIAPVELEVSPECEFIDPEAAHGGGDANYRDGTEYSCIPVGRRDHMGVRVCTDWTEDEHGIRRYGPPYACGVCQTIHD